MPVELIKIVNGQPAHVSANLLNSELVKCCLCGQTYQFRYSDGESHRLKEWLPKAEKAVTKSHADAHSAASIPFSW